MENTYTDLFRGCLTKAEWREIVSLDYVLTWGYTENYNKDLQRYKELSNKRWVSLNNKLKS